jgi:hypothetical protein
MYCEDSFYKTIRPLVLMLKPSFLTVTICYTLKHFDNRRPPSYLQYWHCQLYVETNINRLRSFKMKENTCIILFIVVCCFSSTQAADRSTRFVLDIRPGSFLLSPDLEGFTLRDAGNTSRETISDGFSWTPSINAGVGWTFATFDLNITAGPGYIWNDGFNGSFWQVDAGALFKIADGRLRIGPHIGIVGLSDAKWDPLTNNTGNGQVDLSGNTGFKGGLAFHAGSERVAFLANIDFVDVSYDVTTRSGWVAQDDQGKQLTELDMSGVMIDLGLIIRF